MTVGSAPRADGSAATAVACREKHVGEVRVQVRLTSVGDLELVRRGQLRPDQVRHYTATRTPLTLTIRTGALLALCP
jgi:hypothetical protein